MKANIYLVFFIFFFISFYAQNDSIVKPKSQLSVVALDKMNVVYRGMPNPISIAVNNAKSYIVSGDGVSKSGDGKYIIRPGSGTETKVFVEIENFDGSKVIEEHVFRIKGLPRPIGTLNNEYSTNGTLTFTKSEIKDAIVSYKMVDFLFDINPEVKQFNLSKNPKKHITIKGNKFNNEALELIKSAKKNDYLIISEIKTNYMSADQCFFHYPLPIVFKVTN